MTVTPELSNRPNKHGLHTIQIRITHKRKLKRIALEYAIPLADWNPVLFALVGDNTNNHPGIIASWVRMPICANDTLGDIVFCK